MDKTEVIVVGGGAAGLMAAGRAAELGRSVTIIEKNTRCAKKLLITGKGRCNVTNNCDIDTLLKNIPKNPRFLYSAFNRFSPQDTIDFFEDRNLSLKTERGNRVFPESDRAVDVANVLIQYAKDNNVNIISDTVEKLQIENGVLKGVCTKSDNFIEAESVIIATGGLSYPLTGSTGDGYRLAESAGHTIQKTKPSLIPVITNEKWCRDLMGLSLKNVTLTVKSDGKVIFHELGEMLFTHFGVSGPLVLSASSVMKDYKTSSLTMHVDLKPGLDEKQLDARVLRDFKKFSNRDFINSLGELLPRKMIPVAVQLSDIPYEQKINQISREDRTRFINIIKNLTMTVAGYRPVEEAIITSGGVEVSEISPKTMESKKLKGLYFAGEVIDVDGFTGGFNLQIAFSTGVLAGENC